MSKLDTPPATRGEATRITQTIMGAYGNCQSACLAMMLGVPLESVPNFAQLAQDIGDNEAYAAQGQWLRDRGWGILTVVKWQSLPWPPRHGYFIAGGPSPRGHRHAVIYKDGELWHDPHPEGGGISEVQDIDFLYPLTPFARSETPRSESDEEWYERETTAFKAWWESEGEKKFSATPTMAAGAGWLARAEAARSATRLMQCPRCDADLELWDKLRPEANVVVATEKGLTPTGQHIADCERDAKRWAALIFMHPMDIATEIMGAQTGTEMMAGLERRADAFLAKVRSDDK